MKLQQQYPPQRRDRDCDTPTVPLNQVCDTTCERVVIGTLMQYVWAYSQEGYRLRQDLFTDPLCHHCMEAIEQLVRESKNTGFINVCSEISRLHPEAPITEVMRINGCYTHTESDFADYVGRLNDLCLRRDLVRLGQVLLEEGGTERMPVDELLETAQRTLKDITTRNVPAGAISLAGTMATLKEFFEQRQQGELLEKGTLTGFDELDKEGGLMPGQLCIIAGATSHGKTSFALSILRQVMAQRVPAALFSLEMGHRELGARFLAMETGISSATLLNPRHQAEEQEYTLIRAATDHLKERGDLLALDDRFSASFDNICRSIRTSHYLRHIQGVVVDYLQILSASQQVSNREQFMGEVARQLKNLAVELNIWIIALSQLNRDPKAPLPNIDRLRDSGQIAEAADRVLLVYRAEAAGTAYPFPYEKVDPHGTALVSLVKNRNGQTQRFFTAFSAQQTLFSPLPEKGVPPERRDPQEQQQEEEELFPLKIF